MVVRDGYRLEDESWAEATRQDADTIVVDVSTLRGRYILRRLTGLTPRIGIRFQNQETDIDIVKVSP